jgi:hypothetical protein
MRQVSFLWQKMNEEEKEIYKILSDQDRDRFDLERKEYKSKLTLLKITLGSKVPVTDDPNASEISEE